jgi:WD40 repeat protein
VHDRPPRAARPGAALRGAGVARFAWVVRRVDACLQSSEMGSEAIDPSRDIGHAEHDAFISYSRAVDGLLAPALQSALQRFAKPWYRARAKRVFRDDASLSANPGLWSSIEQALDAARYFVLLASPEAAESAWVGKEVSYWLANKSADRLLLVLTDGEIAWDDGAGDFAWGHTTALPRTLAHAFREEPRYSDMRWARARDHVSLSDPRFRDAVAEVAAPLHGRPKDELIGEEVRQHRRTVRLVRGAVVLLSALALAATLAAIFAVRQRNTARAERNRAEQQARIALSRGVAGQALVRLESRPDLGFLLALGAYATRPTPEARAAAAMAVQRSDRMIAILRRRAPVSRTIHEVVFSPDGSTLAARADGEVVLWSISTRRPVAILQQRGIGSIAFSPNRKLLAVPDHDEVRLWDWSGPRPTFERLPSSGDTVIAVAFSRDGKLLAAGSRDGSVSVWDVARRRVRRTLVPSGVRVPDVGSAVLSVAFSPDQRWLASGHADGMVVLWDVLSWKAAGRASRADGDGVSAVLFRPDGKTLVAEARSGDFWLWNYRDRSGVRRLLGSQGVGLLSVAYSPDGRILASGDRLGGVRLWDASTRKSVGTPLVERGPPLDSLAFSPNGKILASADRQGTIVLWDPHHGLSVRLWNPHGALQRVAFDHARRILAVAVGSTITLRDIRNRSRPGRALVGMSDAVVALAFSPDGKTLAAGARDGRIALWRVASRELLGTIQAYMRLTTDIAFSPDSKTLASTGDDVGSLPVKLWDVRTLRRTSRPLEHTTGFPTSVAFGPDGQTLASGDASGTILVWDLTARAPVPRRLLGHARNVEGLAFSRDGNVLASASADSTLRLWDMTTRSALGQPLDNSSGLLPDLALSPDGRTLASTGVSEDARGDLTVHEVRLWDVPTRRPIGDPLRVGAAVIAVAFRQDGNRLYAAAEDGSLTSWDGILWTTRLADLRARLCGIVGRGLTREEWAEFLSGQPYRETCA